MKKDEKYLFEPNPSLFHEPVEIKPAEKRNLVNFDLNEYKRLRDSQDAEAVTPEVQILDLLAVAEKSDTSYSEIPILSELNPEQQKAAEHGSGPALIIAGPGSGRNCGWNVGHPGSDVAC